VKRNVATAQASMEEVVLPERVQEALGQLVGAAKEGLLALSVGVGLGVLAELLEEEVDEVVGPKGKWDPERPRSGMATSRARSRSAAGAFRSSGRGCGPWTGRPRCGLRPTSTSPTAIRWREW